MVEEPPVKPVGLVNRLVTDPAALIAAAQTRCDEIASVNTFTVLDPNVPTYQCFDMLLFVDVTSQL